MENALKWKTTSNGMTSFVEKRPLMVDEPGGTRPISRNETDKLDLYKLIVRPRKIEC